ncbi:MAG: PqqD family protein [Acidimicrobiales bacterium]
MADPSKPSETVYKLDADRAAWRVVEDELVVLDLETSAYLSINETGTSVWPSLETGATRDELITAVLDTYDIDSETAGRDIDVFLESLQQRGLLVTDPE